MQRETTTGTEGGTNGTNTDINAAIRGAGNRGEGDGMTLIERQIKALEGSIEKWWCIVHDGAEDDGPNDCPCCKEFRTRDDETELINCDNCPVFEDTKQTGCGGTPYWDYEVHGVGCDEHWGGEQCDECTSIAQLELDYLTALKTRLEARNAS